MLFENLTVAFDIAVLLVVEVSHSLLCGVSVEDRGSGHTCAEYIRSSGVRVVHILPLVLLLIIYAYSLIAEESAKTLAALNGLEEFRDLSTVAKLGIVSIVNIHLSFLKLFNLLNIWHYTGISSNRHGNACQCGFLEIWDIIVAGSQLMIG